MIILYIYIRASGLSIITKEKVADSGLLRIIQLFKINSLLLEICRFFFQHFGKIVVI